MLIRQDSHFRKLPVRLDPKQRVLFEGISHCISAADHCHLQLQANLLHIAKDSVSGVVGLDKTAASFSMAWTILDSTHRLRLLLQRVPKWGKVPQIRLFVEKTAVITKVRNGFQHLDTELEGLAAKNLPAWGILHWSSPSTIEGAGDYPSHHTLIAGGLTPGPTPILKGSPGPPGAAIWGVSLRAFGHHVKLDEVVVGMGVVADYFEGSFAKQFADKPSMGSGFHIVFVHVPKSQLDGQGGPGGMVPR